MKKKTSRVSRGGEKAITGQLRQTLIQELSRLSNDSKIEHAKIYDLVQGNYLLHNLRAINNENWGVTILATVENISDKTKYKVFLPSIYKGLASSLLGHLRSPLQITIFPLKEKKTARIDITNNHN